jgi:hypothetical protein
MFVIVSVAMSALAGMAVTWMTARAGSRRTVAAALQAIIIVESLSVPVSLGPVITDPPRVYRWLAVQPRAPVLEWPLPDTANLGFTDAPRQMYFSTWHWQPLVNGYSGFYPRSFELMVNRTKNFPDTQAIRELQRVGVRYMLLHSVPNEQAYIAARVDLSARPEARLLFTDQIGAEEVAVYELRAD